MLKFFIVNMENCQIKLKYYDLIDSSYV